MFTIECSVCHKSNLSHAHGDWPHQAIHGANMSMFEPSLDLSTYACQIWSRSDGRVENMGDRHTDKGTPQPYIVDGAFVDPKT